MNELEKAVDKVLLEHLSDSLKADIDRLLARGVSKGAILWHIRSIINETSKNPQEGKTTMAAVQVYLERK